MSIDLKDGEGISFPMMYFQARHLQRLFDLRAFCFIDSRHTKLENRILGTLLLGKALSRMKSYIEELEVAFGEARQIYDRERDVGEMLRGSWDRFINGLPEHVRSVRLRDEIFRDVFAPELEANLVRYPLEDYAALLTFLEPSHEHLILVRNDIIVNVRTIDRAAREIARNSVEAVLRLSSTEKQNRG